MPRRPTHVRWRFRRAPEPVMASVWLSLAAVGRLNGGMWRPDVHEWRHASHSGCQRPSLGCQGSFSVRQENFSGCQENLSACQNSFSACRGASSHGLSERLGCQARLRDDHDHRPGAAARISGTLLIASALAAGSVPTVALPLAVEAMCVSW